ncbi:hypothetical protein DsansV1_C25g0185811 [Dioscorea sansibarensis]
MEVLPRLMIFWMIIFGLQVMGKQVLSNIDYENKGKKRHSHLRCD